MASQVRSVSWSPDDFVTGGLLNDVDVEVEDAAFTMEAPVGYNVAVATMFFRMDLKDLSTGDVTAQYWSCGAKAAEEFEPSQDGRYALIAKQGGKGAFVKGSNFHVLAESLCAHGFPKASCGDAWAVKGIQMHMVRIPGKGLSSGPPAGGGGDDGRTVLVCERMIRGPKGAKPVAAPAAAKAKAPARGAAAAQAAPAPAEVQDANPADAANEEHLVEVVSEILTAGGGFMVLQNLKAKLYMKLSSLSTADRQAAIQLVTQDWLVAHGFGYDADSNTVAAA